MVFISAQTDLMNNPLRRNQTALQLLLTFLNSPHAAEIKDQASHVQGLVTSA